MPVDLPVNANSKEKLVMKFMYLFHFWPTFQSQEQMIYLKITILFMLVVISGMFLWNISSEGPALREVGNL